MHKHNRWNYEIVNLRNLGYDTVVKTEQDTTPLWVEDVCRIQQDLNKLQTSYTCLYKCPIQFEAAKCMVEKERKYSKNELTNSNEFPN